MQVVLDTNVIISGLFFGGKPGRVVELVFEKAITPCFTVTTWTEFERILLHQKFARQRANLSFEISTLITQLETCAHIYPVPEYVPNVIPDDPADNHIVACAVLAGAIAIVSGDRHLLRLKGFHEIPIFTPEQFLKQYEAEKIN